MHKHVKSIKWFVVEKWETFLLQTEEKDILWYKWLCPGSIFVLNAKSFGRKKLINDHKEEDRLGQLVFW